ncbi:MAG TPA: ABC transporter permease [Anaerolineae bacterium]|nr:ABC transporter permease [Anaerolineae bacterium]HNU03616.1 ABC transporter permease [Anaerolineae bacterium]
MNRILNIARKDTLLRFASPSELLFFIVLPVIFTMVVSNFASGQANSDNRIAVLVVNQDGGALSQDLVQVLTDGGSVRPETLDAAAAAAQFDDGDAPALLTIPAGFEASLRAGQPVDLDLQLEPTSVNGMAAQQAIEAAAAQVSRALSAADSSVAAAEQLRPFDDASQRTAYFDASLAAAQNLLAAAPERMVAVAAVQEQREEYSGALQGSAGQMLVWVFIPLLGTSGMMVSERVTGTLKRLLTTPTSTSTYLLGTVVGQYSLSIVQMLLLVGFGALVLNIRWGPPAAVLGVLMAFGLSSVAMGVMLGAFVKSENQANGLSIMLGMVFGMMSGSFWPLEFFPPVMQKIVFVIPMTWAMQALTDLGTRGRDFGAILPAIGYMLASAVLFFLVGVKRFRYE